LKKKFEKKLLDKRRAFAYIDDVLLNAVLLNKQETFLLIKNGRGIRPDDTVATGSALRGTSGANSCPFVANGKDEKKQDTRLS
jgi:hypothetical protein